MTTTAEHPTLDQTVGTRIANREHLASLPDGTRITSERRGAETKDGEYWNDGDGGRRHVSSFNPETFTYTISYVPGEQAEEQDSRIGQAVTDRDTLTSLPVGAQITSSRTGIVYTKRTDGDFDRSNGGTRAAARIGLSGHMRISSIPTFSPVRDEDMDVETPDADATACDSFTRYVQRFRTVTYGQAQRAGVSLDPLDRAMDKLGIEPCSVTPGIPVDGSDYIRIRELPSGSVLMAGKDPANWTTFGVFGANGDSSLIYLLGGVDSPHGHVLHTVNIAGSDASTPDWVTEPATEEDAVLIDEFKRKAWELGVKAKRENSWCSDYEAAMERMGINEILIEQAQLTLIDAEAAAALPEGTILRYTVAGSRDSVIYRRDDRSTNPAKTVRIGGTLPGAWRSTGLQAVDTPLRIKVISHEEMDSMPHGTVMSDGSSATWTKENGEWKSPGRFSTGYASNRFSITNLFYTGFPA